MAIDPTLPAEARARVNLVTGDRQRRRRLGRVTFLFDVETSTARAVHGGTEVAAGVVVAVESMGQQAWQLTMDDGSLWVVMAGGCGCGG